MARVKYWVIGLVFLGTVGCSGGGSGSATTAPPATTTPPAATESTAPSSSPPTTPPSPAPTPPMPTPMGPAALVHEMDPDKHTASSGPINGRLVGKPFTPTVILEGPKLTFRQGPETNPELEVIVTLPTTPGKTVEGTKLKVKPIKAPSDPPAPGMLVSVPKPGSPIPEATLYADGYAMTLELGKRTGDKIPGSITLCLPDNDKSVLTGTFEAAWERPATEPPEPADQPFIRGGIDLKAPGKGLLTVGYAGIGANNELATDTVGTLLPEMKDAPDSWSRSNTNKPRLATLLLEKGKFRYEFIRLPAGRYLVYARLPDGVNTWKLTDVKAGDSLTLDLVVDPAPLGGLEVTLPKEMTGELRLAPAEVGATDPQRFIAANFGLALDYKPTVKDGKATFTNVVAGKYRLMSLADPAAEGDVVEVVAGKTTPFEIKPKKK